MKRKQQEKRRLRSRVQVDDLAFDFTHEEPRHEIHIRVLSGRSPKSDKKHFEVTFTPPLKKQEASRAHIRLIYTPTRASHCSIVVIPKSKRQTPSQLYGKHYLTFDSHTVQLNPEKGEVVLLYLSVHNIQVDGKGESPPQYAPMFQLNHQRYTGLPFFPPDPDMALNQQIEASRIPQSAPMGFKLRGEVTGSQLTELLGFYVPEPGTKEAAAFELGKRDASMWTGWKAAGVRFGNLREDYVTLCLLEHNKQLQFHECGYFTHPDPQRANWGTSPDGILYDPHVKYPKEFDFDSITLEDRTRGVVEIKSSLWNCKFNGYFFPQCIWEMVCAQTGWGDVVRYCERRALDQETRTWGTLKECRKIRLFRHLPTEQRMVTLVLESLAARKEGKDAFLSLMQTDAFVQIRAHFEQIAEAANSQCETIPVAEEAISRLLAERRKIIESQDEHVPSLHPAMDRIDARQSDIFRLYQEPKRTKHGELLLRIGEQVEDYMELLKSTL